MGLSSKLILSIVSELTSVMDLATARVPMDFTKQLTLTSGVGANQADRIFHDTRPLSASANEDLDLAGGVTDALGQTVTFARVKGIIVVAPSANVNNVVVGGAATNTFVGPFGAATHTAHVRPGGWQAFVAPDATGWAVTAGTGDLLRLANSAGGSAVNYDIVIIGASA